MTDVKQRNNPATQGNEVDLDALGQKWVSNLAQTRADQIATVDGDKNPRHLLHLAIDMACLSDEDCHGLVKAITLAAFKRDEDSSASSVIPHVIQQLSSAVKVGAQKIEVSDFDEVVPDFSYAPRNEFRGAHEDGDPYSYLMESYGPWLRKGRECLDRPTLAQFDKKLLKALQQRSARKPDSMPRLAEIFPSKVTALNNQHDYMAGRTKKAG